MRSSRLSYGPSHLSQSEDRSCTHGSDGLAVLVNVHRDGWPGVPELISDLSRCKAGLIKFCRDHLAEGPASHSLMTESVQFGADDTGDVAGPVGRLCPVGAASQARRKDERRA